MKGVRAHLACLLLVLSGCTTERPARTDAELEAHREKLIAEMLDGRTKVSRMIVDRTVAEQAAEATPGGQRACLDFLILSGGGDYGAFGAGVLKGWGTVRSAGFERPEFDVVTGVSTGALIAPLAFVGTEESYERAFQTYQNPKPDWFKQRGLIDILFEKQSFADNRGLREEVGRTIDASMIRQIAEGNAQNRVLLIGTTNLDLGMMTMWNLGLIASQIIDEGRRRDRLDDVVMASASIPGAFPPVEIDGDLYVDGGVTRNIAYMTDQEFPNSAVNIWKREHAGDPVPRLRIWVIINNQIVTPPKSVSRGWPAQLLRSLEISIRSATLSSLKGIANMMLLLRKEDRGADLEFRYIAIPDEWRPPVEGAFQKETMTSLAELGFRMGADPAGWEITVPNPESPEP